MFGIDTALIIMGVAALGSLIIQGVSAHNQKEAMGRAEDRAKADGEEAKYKNGVMNLKQFNAAIEVQKRGILLDKVETIEVNRKKKYKNHGSPVGHA